MLGFQQKYAVTAVEQFLGLHLELVLQPTRYVGIQAMFLQQAIAKQAVSPVTQWPQ